MWCHSHVTSCIFLECTLIQQVETIRCHCSIPFQFNSALSLLRPFQFNSNVVTPKSTNGWSSWPLPQVCSWWRLRWCGPWLHWWLRWYGALHIQSQLSLCHFCSLSQVLQGIREPHCHWIQFLSYRDRVYAIVSKIRYKSWSWYHCQGAVPTRWMVENTQSSISISRTFWHYLWVRPHHPKRNY